VSQPTEFSFTRYLAAKKSLDDRALNRHVFNTLSSSLSTWPGSAPLQVLEVGCGIGTMVERLLDWGVLQNAVYTAIDLEPANIAAARERLRFYAAGRGYRLREEGGSLCLEPGPDQSLQVVLEAIDLYDFLEREQGRRVWDLLIAHAFLDLVDLPATLPRLLSLLAQGGLYYFTLNFDGTTIFLPIIDPALDPRIEELYHQTMDQRLINGRPSGHSQTGRRLSSLLPDLGAQVLAAGSSDWLVRPGPGGYPGDEAFFLHYLIQTLATALTGHPQVPPNRFRDWLEERHRQIDRGDLIYLARQLDFLGILRESDEKG
jgi:SAM-dependent methyltransferase